MNLQRIKKIQEAMTTEEILITDPANLFYLTGQSFSPDERLIALILPKEGGPTLVNNELFPLKEIKELPVLWYKDEDPIIQLLSQKLKGKTIGVDKSLPARFLLPLMAASKVSFQLDTFVDAARLIKDDDELEAMRQVSLLNDAAMERLIKEIDGLKTEQQLTDRLAEIYEELGADGFSFDPIVAFGSNGADPHHETDASRAHPGDSIILDIGCKKAGYCADMTRTVFLDDPSEDAQKVYDTVRRANLAGIAAVRPGATFAQVDAACRDLIEKAGYGPYFTHRTGHGIGIEVHEPHDVSRANQAVLKPGMIFSIEPGIYLQGHLGVRIEDLVLVTEDGCEVLNKVSKDLTSLSR